MALFGGASCLLDSFSDCGKGSSWYPVAGIGLIFDLKPRYGVVVRLDYAHGKEGNSGLYLSFGQPF